MVGNKVKWMTKKRNLSVLALSSRFDGPLALSSRFEHIRPAVPTTLSVFGLRLWKACSDVSFSTRSVESF